MLQDLATPWELDDVCSSRFGRSPFISRAISGCTPRLVLVLGLVYAALKCRLCTPRGGLCPRGWGGGPSGKVGPSENWLHFSDLRRTHLPSGHRQVGRTHESGDSQWEARGRVTPVQLGRGSCGGHARAQRRAGSARRALPTETGPVPWERREATKPRAVPGKEALLAMLLKTPALCWPTISTLELKRVALVSYFLSTVKQRPPPPAKNLAIFSPTLGLSTIPGVSDQDCKGEVSCLGVESACSWAPRRCVGAGRQAALMSFPLPVSTCSLAPVIPGRGDGKEVLRPNTEPPPPGTGARGSPGAGRRAVRGTRWPSPAREEGRLATSAPAICSCHGQRSVQRLRQSLRAGRGGVQHSGGHRAAPHPRAPGCRLCGLSPAAAHRHKSPLSPRLAPGSDWPPPPRCHPPAPRV